MRLFVYGAFGHHRYMRECIYSVWTLLQSLQKRDTAYQILIITDNKQALKELQGLEHVCIDELDGDTVSEWTQGYAYMPRAKIKAMGYAFDKYKADAVFVDTDTLILQNPLSLFEQISWDSYIMHMACTPLGRALAYAESINKENASLDTRVRLGFYQALDQNGAILGLGEIDRSFVPYNSGIIGMSYQRRHLLPMVERVSDFIFAQYGYTCAEEFAFSYCFAVNGTIHTAERTVYHYPDAKFTRFLAGYALDKFVPGDREEGELIFQRYGMENVADLRLSLEDIPFYVRFAMQYYRTVLDELGVNSLNDVYLYLDDKSDYYKEHNGKSAYKRYLKRAVEVSNAKKRGNF